MLGRHDNEAFRDLWDVVWGEKLGKWFKSAKRWIWKFGAVAGHHELRFILTVDGDRWVLSVLPCRFGRMYEWEYDEIKRAFQMVEPVTVKQAQELTFFKWTEAVR